VARAHTHIHTYAHTHTHTHTHQLVELVGQAGCFPQLFADSDRWRLRPEIKKERQGRGLPLHWLPRDVGARHGLCVRGKTSYMRIRARRMHACIRALHVHFTCVYLTASHTCIRAHDTSRTSHTCIRAHLARVFEDCNEACLSPRPTMRHSTRTFACVHGSTYRRLRAALRG
jgi:hypothetical protein